MAVYFIQADGGPVKIGHSIKPYLRLVNLRIATERELVIIRLIEGGAETEREMHERFAAQHIRREWFRPHPDMMTVGRSIPVRPCRERSNVIGAQVMVRLQPAQLQEVEDFRRAEPDYPSIPEAIRRMVRIGLDEIALAEIK